MDEIAVEGGRGEAALMETPPSDSGIEVVLHRADELYQSRSFNDAQNLLASLPQTAETLWRQARVYKDLAEVENASGAKVGRPRTEVCCTMDIFANSREHDCICILVHALERHA